MSVYLQGWPGTQGSSPSVSQVLALQVCVTPPTPNVIAVWWSWDSDLLYWGCFRALWELPQVLRPIARHEPDSILARALEIRVEICSEGLLTWMSELSVPPSGCSSKRRGSLLVARSGTRTLSIRGVCLPFSARCGTWTQTAHRRV